MNNYPSNSFSTVFFLVIVFIGMGLLMYHSYEVTAQNGELKQTVSTLETQVADLDVKNTALEADKAALTSQNEKLQSDYTSLAAENLALKTDSEELKTENARLQGELASLQSENASLKLENAALTQASQQLAAAPQTAPSAEQGLIPVTGADGGLLGWLSEDDGLGAKALLGLELAFLLPSGFVIFILVKDILKKARLASIAERTRGGALPRRARSRIVNSHFV